MKKNILIITLIVMTIGILTGCGKEEENKVLNKNEKEITCNMIKTNDDGFEEKSTMLIKTKNDKVIEVEEITLEKMEEETLEMSYGFASMFAISLNEINGYTVSFEKVGNDTLKSYYKVEYDKIDIDEVKETLEDGNDNSILKDINITYSEFKEKNLKEYECK